MINFDGTDIRLLFLGGRNFQHYRHMQGGSEVGGTGQRIRDENQIV